MPSPRPDESDPGFAQWLEEYHSSWRDATCPCGRGYFCQEHGRWISGSKLPDTSYRDHDHQGYSSCRDLGIHGPRDVSPPPVRVVHEDQSSSVSMSRGGQSPRHGFYTSHTSAAAPLYYDEDADSSILEHYDTTNTHGSGATGYFSEIDGYPTTSTSQWVPQASLGYERGLDHDEVPYSVGSSSSAHVSTVPSGHQARSEDSQSIESALYDTYDPQYEAAYDYRSPDFD